MLLSEPLLQRLPASRTPQGYIRTFPASYDRYAMFAHYAGSTVASVRITRDVMFNLAGSCLRM